MGDNDWVERKRIILEGPRKGLIITERLLRAEVEAEDRHIQRLEEIEEKYLGRTDWWSQMQKSQEIFRENSDYAQLSLRLSQTKIQKMMRENEETLRKMLFRKTLP